MTDRSKLIARLKQQPKQGADPFNDFKDTLKDIFEVYKTQGKDAIRSKVFGTINKEVTDLYNELSILEQRNRGIQSSFQVSTKRAAELSQQFDGLAAKVGLTSAKFNSYVANLQKVFVGNTKLFKVGDQVGTALSEQAKALQDNLKLSDQQANQFVKFQLLAGKVANRGDITKSMQDTQQAIADVAAAMGGDYESALAAITQGIGDLDSATLATFGKVPKNLALAVTKANKLGIELTKITGMGKQFLDVEQSIGAELEFQILSGKELKTSSGENLANEFRKAAVAQDANRQAELYADFIKQFGDDLQDNIYLQEQATSMFDLSQEQLFDSIAAVKASTATAEDPAKQFENIFTKTAENIGKTEKSFTDMAAEQSQKTKDEQLADDQQMAYRDELIKQNTDYVASIEKLSTTIDGIQSQANAAASTITEAISESDFASMLTGIGGTAAFWTGFAKQLASGTLTGQGESVTGQGLQHKEDLFIPASGGDTVISGPYGAFTLPPGDDILAAPGIREAGGGGASAVIAALSKMSFHVNNVFDGDKIKSSLEIRQGQTLNNINNIA